MNFIYTHLDEGNFLRLIHCDILKKSALILCILISFSALFLDQIQRIEKQRKDLRKIS